MTKEEARNIYGIASAVCIKEEDVRRLCKDKGVPDELIDELIKEDDAWKKFIDKHDMDGNVIQKD